MSQGGKILPNLDQNGTKILNLTVLQRIDPSIEEILMTAAHVAFYEFNIELNQWSRKDVEGSLFVVKRGAEPRFQFIVMNRRNTDNLVENLSADFEYELQVPYLLYRNAVQEVNGIWFYNSRECEEVAHLFDRIQNTCLKLQSQLQVPSSKSSEYDELEGAPQGAMVGSLESMSASRRLTDIEDSRFSNFFTVATNLGNNGSTAGKQAHFQHSSMNLSTSSNGTSHYQSSVPSMQLRSSTATVPSAPSIPVVHPHDNSSELMRKPSQIADLLKPSFFYNPPSTSSSASVAPPGSSMPPTVSLQPSSTTQSTYSTPLLQPFPPPHPPLRQNPPSMEPVIERDKVRQALFTLVQDNQFVEMVYQALKKVHET